MSGGTDHARNRAASSTLLGGGLLLILLSFAAPQLLSGRETWNEQLAVQLQQASHNYHAALHERAHEHAADGTGPQGMETARGEYERLQVLLEAAQTRGNRTAGVLLSLGILASGAGLVLRVVGLLTPTKA